MGPLRAEGWPAWRWLLSVTAASRTRAGERQAERRPAELARTLRDRQTRAGEGVAGVGAAPLVALREPLCAERRRSVCPLLRAAGSEAVVADGGGGRESFLDVAGLENAALVGGVRPDTGEAVGLQLESHRELVLPGRVFGLLAPHGRRRSRAGSARGGRSRVR